MGAKVKATGKPVRFRLPLAAKATGVEVRVEKRPTSFGGYVSDLRGCVAVAKTRRKVKVLIREAIQLHIEDMRARGYPIPKPTTASEVVELQRA